jgi:hypothetical protein
LLPVAHQLELFDSRSLNVGKAVHPHRDLQISQTTLPIQETDDAVVGEGRPAMQNDPVPDRDSARSNFIIELASFNQWASSNLPADIDYGKLASMVHGLNVFAGTCQPALSTNARPRFLHIQRQNVSPNQHIQRQKTFTSTRPAKRKRKEDRRKPDYQDFAAISQDLGREIYSIIPADDDLL